MRTYIRHSARVCTLDSQARRAERQTNQRKCLTKLPNQTSNIMQTMQDDTRSELITRLVQDYGLKFSSDRQFCVMAAARHAAKGVVHRC